MVKYTFSFGNAVVIAQESCLFSYLVSSLCSSHMLQNISKPWREETIHLCNAKASQQRFIMADVACGDKEECLWPALLTRQRVRPYERPTESETRSQPGPAHINPSFMILQLCITDAVFESSFGFCPLSPWSFHLFPSLVTQSSEMAELRRKNDDQQMALGRVFLFWCQIGPLSIKPPLRTATPWSNHTLPVISHERTSILAVTLPKLWTCPGRAFGSVFINSELAGLIRNHWIISPLRIMPRFK